MTTDLLHRIRWANVARAAALLLAVLLAVAWPRLRGHAEALPPAVATPATAQEATEAVPEATVPVAVPRAKAATARPRAPTRAKARRVRRPAKTHARRRKKAVASPRPVVSSPPVAAAPVWRPPPRASPAVEFRP